MRRFLLYIFLIVVALAAYHYFFNKKEVSATRRLSIFVDDHIDEVLGPLPLSQKGRIDPPSFKHDILLLQQDIQDLKSTAAPKERLAVTTAVSLCNVLLSSSIVREQHIARINDTRSKNNLSQLDTWPVQQAEERLRFFEEGIASSWKREAATLRLRINKLYEQLREAER